LGCLGINLTAADTCIIHDLDFNPFNDLQAEDRCHRIGQKKKVTVYKMVAKDCVDAAIYEMQERKAKMNAAIMESNSEKMQKKDMLQHAMKSYLSKGDSSNDKRNVGDSKKKKAICLI
jgi:SWI/SNF-related matrix-associated actin-dependent regulator 1 of chromatin subfamily A